MSFKTWLIDKINAALPDPGQPVKEAAFREAAGTTIDADEDQWRKLTGNSTRDLTPMTQWRMQRIAHYLWEQNLLGNRLIELPVAYLLADGVKLSVEDEDNQKTLDRFWKDPINEMDLKLTKKVREMAIFGEQCWPAFVNDADGMVRLGYLDPAQIETVVKDPDNPEQTIGIVTTKNKRGLARRYRVIINGDEEVFTQRTQAIRQTFADGDAFYFPVNDLSSGTRGRSDLLAQADWLDAYDQFMFGEIERYDMLRAFIWDVTLVGANPDDVKKRAQEISAPKPGSVRVHNDAETWKAETPELNAVDTSDGARLFRNHVLGGATVPETWFGGGGDVNRATAAEMNEPTFKMLSMRQRYWKHILESIGRYVLYKVNEKAGGKTIDWSDPAWTVVAEFPELSVKDTSKYAAALAQVATACVQAITAKLMTRGYAVRIIGAVAARLGVEADPEQELTDAQAEADTAAEQDVFTTPPGSEPAPSDAAAAMQEALDLVREHEERVGARLTEIENAAAARPPQAAADAGQFAEALAEQARSTQALIEALGARFDASGERFTEALEREAAAHAQLTELLGKPRSTHRTITLPDGRVFTLTERDEGEPR